MCFYSIWPRGLQKRGSQAQELEYFVCEVCYVFHKANDEKWYIFCLLYFSELVISTAVVFYYTYMLDIGMFVICVETVFQDENSSYFWLYCSSVWFQVTTHFRELQRRISFWVCFYYYVGSYLTWEIYFTHLFIFIATVMLNLLVKRI